MSIQVGIPIRPAAAERLLRQKQYCKTCECIAQPKLDGFRLQVHVDNTTKTAPATFFHEICWICHSCFPILPKHSKSWMCKPWFVRVKLLSMMHRLIVFCLFKKRWNANENMHRRSYDGAATAILYFDLLYLNGVSYLEETHEARRKELKKLFKSMKTETVQVIDEVWIQAQNNLRNILQKMFRRVWKV